MDRDRKRQKDRENERKTERLQQRYVSCVSIGMWVWVSGCVCVFACVCVYVCGRVWVCLYGCGCGCACVGQRERELPTESTSGFHLKHRHFAIWIIKYWLLHQMVQSTDTQNFQTDYEAQSNMLSCFWVIFDHGWPKLLLNSCQWWCQDILQWLVGPYKLLTDPSLTWEASSWWTADRQIITWRQDMSERHCISSQMTGWQILVGVANQVTLSHHQDRSLRHRLWFAMSMIGDIICHFWVLKEKNGEKVACVSDSTNIPDMTFTTENSITKPELDKPSLLIVANRNMVH